MHFGTDPDPSLISGPYGSGSGFLPFFSISGEHLSFKFVTFTKTYMVLLNYVFKSKQINVLMIFSLQLSNYVHIEKKVLILLLLVVVVLK